MKSLIFILMFVSLSVTAFAQIQIIQPTNTTYNYTPILFDVNYNQSNLTGCWYNLSGTLQIIENCSTTGFIGTTNGFYSFQIFANYTNSTNSTVLTTSNIINFTTALPNNTIILNGTKTNLNIVWQENQTVEISREKNVSLVFTNLWNRPVTITFPSTYPLWIRSLNGDDNPFQLNVSNSTVLNFSILPQNDTGVYTRNIPFVITWPGDIETLTPYFRVNSIPTQTNVSWSAIKTDFTIEALKEDRGAMQFRVINIVPSFNTTFYCKGHENYTNFTWCRFDLEDQNKTYQPNVSDVLVPTFTTPDFIFSDETNQTYQAEVCTISYNAKEQCVNVSIFVPYSDLKGVCGGTSEADILNLIDALCTRNPKSFLCNPTPEVVEKEVFIKEACQPENLTQEELHLYSICIKDKAILNNQLIESQNNLQLCQNEGITYAKNSTEEARLTRETTLQTNSQNSIVTTIIIILFIVGAILLTIYGWARFNE